MASRDFPERNHALAAFLLPLREKSNTSLDIHVVGGRAFGVGWGDVGCCLRLSSPTVVAIARIVFKQVELLALYPLDHDVLV
mmetsp:Transcript_15222/g.35221  ORF Transcript_15222/g.35221 Transcript_15222/m.35221 type:complete len:82 (-) Transcript_15222:1237-1482(-)